MEEQVENTQTLAPMVEDDTKEYLWITNEGLLRDEGVIFGMEGADTSAKMDAIRSFHEREKAPIRKETETLHARIDEISEQLKKNQSHIDKLKSEVQDFPSSQLVSLDMGIIFQLIAYMAICILNYSLLRFWSYPVFGSDFIIAGIYLLGLFSVFSGRGSIYRMDGKQMEGEGRPSREIWKVYAEEYFIPLCTSIFVVVMSWENFQTYQNISFFTLLTILFVFSGKGFVFILYLFKEWQSGFFKNWSESRRKKKMAKGIERNLKECIVEKDSLEKTKAELRKQLDDAVGKISGLEALEEYRIKLFMSEFNVAATAYGKNR